MSRAPVIWFLLIIVPLGFALKYYSGPGHAWCNLYGAGVAYEIFWCLLAILVFPKGKNIPVIAITVFAATCALEFLQLWHPVFLELVRRTMVGSWLIGNGFDWFDFPHYAAGCGLGYLALRLLLGKTGKISNAEMK